MREAEDIHAADERLEAAFGSLVHWWPAPDPVPPAWWQFRRRSRERRINAALARAGFGPVTDGMREVFWTERSYGQDVMEDAGGYIWRCWAAMLGLPFRAAAFTYSGHVNRAADPDHPMFTTGVADDLGH